MAGQDRTATQALALFRELAEEPWRWSFYAAVRQIEALYPDKPGLGDSRSPKEDPVRLGQEPSLAFSPAELARFEMASGEMPPRLRVFFQGLFGPNGPLPLHLTEYARARQHNDRDFTLGRFADVFHHRFLSLFYRAWANAQPVVNVERPRGDRFAHYVASFVGLGQDSLRNRDALGDNPKLHYAGLFASGTKPAEGLQRLLSDYFETPVRIREFMGEWLDLPADSYLRLGRDRNTCSLGQSAVLGPRIWGCQHRFRIVAGPLGYQRFRQLMPGRGGLRRMVAAVRLFCGDEMSWDLQIALDPDEVPKLELGRQGYLGRTSWLHSTDRHGAADDAILHPARELALESAA